MRGKNLKNRVLNLLLIIIMLFMSISIPETTTAASKYIKVNEFINQLIQALNIDVNTTSNQPYINAAITSGILNAEDFNNYDEYITRTDACVLLNRADEYLHGTNSLDEKLYNFVLTKRISDIKKITESKRESVAKIVAKGIIKGYSNGYYIQNREFRGSKYLTKTGANEYINLVINPGKRAKLSPDGMLIRTSKLPKNYKQYEYILECYPNSFYEMKYYFSWDLEVRNVEKDLYSYPVDMKNRTWGVFFLDGNGNEIYKEYPYKNESDKNLDIWTKRVEEYLKIIFNVDYRTINSTWKTNLYNCYATPVMGASKLESGIQEYIDGVKKNKVIIESKIISAEPSTVYYFQGAYYMRTYVKYRITAANINVDHGKLLNGYAVSLKNLKNGQWRTGIFDVKLSTGNNVSALGDRLYISNGTWLNDYLNEPIK